MSNLQAAVGWRNWGVDNHVEKDKSVCVTDRTCPQQQVYSWLFMWLRNKYLLGQRRGYLGTSSPSENYYDDLADRGLHSTILFPLLVACVQVSFAVGIFQKC